MGSRGSSSGESLGGGSGKPIKILEEMDVWSYRHNPNNQPFVDEMNTGVRSIQEDFPSVMQDVNYVSASKLGGADAYGTLGYYSPDSKTVALNQNYTNVDKMNEVYGNERGWHPPRGDKTGTYAVATHEMGHALNDHIAKKMNMSLDASAKKIVDDAYKNSGGRNGTKAWAGKISGYAQDSNAECVAEAMADYYCNGSKARSASKAIFREMMKYR